jgi:hypothetical protein
MADEFYVLTTSNLVENKYIGFPLNSVDNHSNKLIYGYSMLVYQYAMSEAAYQYWEQMRSNSLGREDYLKNSLFLLLVIFITQN